MASPLVSSATHLSTNPFSAPIRHGPLSGDFVLAIKTYTTLTEQANKIQSQALAVSRERLVTVRLCVDGLETLNETLARRGQNAPANSPRADGGGTVSRAR